MQISVNLNLNCLDISKNVCTPCRQSSFQQRPEALTVYFKTPYVCLSSLSCLTRYGTELFD
jgi:hypothetical protein